MSFAFWAILAGLAIAVSVGAVPKLWAWAKTAWTTTTGKEVPATIDSFVINWLNTSESVLVQGMLRRARIGFEKRADDEGIDKCNALIVLAATWDDEVEELTTPTTTDDGVVKMLMARIADLEAKAAGITTTTLPTE